MRGRGHGRSRYESIGEGGRGSSNPPSQDKPKKDKSHIKCFNCQHFGHYASECRRTEKAFVAESSKEAEQTSLLMATVEEFIEDGILLQGINSEPYNYDVWYLDTGATNHMSGSKSLFNGIDENCIGKVKFGDGSVVEVEDRGNVLLSCQNGEKKLLSNVLYIPKLKTNILSLGQLDELGCRITIEKGTLSIHDCSVHLLFVVERSNSRLYLLKIKTLETCLISEMNSKAWLWHNRYGHLKF